MSFVDKIVKSSTLPIHCIRCKDIHDRDCFYIVMCSDDKLKMILNADQDILNMTEKGPVLAFGFGHEIPTETKAMLKEKYGFDADSLN